MPIVSGQDAEVPSVKSILAGEQYSTVFKDTRELARVTVGMVDALLQGMLQSQGYRCVCALAAPAAAKQPPPPPPLT